METRQSKEFYGNKNKMNQHKNQYKDDNPTICYCLELRKKDLLNALGAKSGSFEDFLNKTNAGTKCTACMLDLENFYIKNSSQSYNNNKNFSVKNNLKVFKNLKQKLYKFIDAFSPLVAQNRDNVFPVLYRESLKEIIWFSNYPNFFEKKDPEIDFVVKMKFYNKFGKEIWRIVKDLKSSQSWQQEIPTHLLKEGNKSKYELQLGLLVVYVKAKNFGIRGTTRPQVQILTSKASSAVHGQAANKFKNKGGIISIYKPEIEDQFLSFINPSNIKTDLTINRLYDPLDNHANIEIEKKVHIPPFGTYLHNITRTENIKSGGYFNIDWFANGVLKAHFFVCSKSFDRISIDHA